MKPQKWLLLEGDDGWQVVVPSTDTKAHGIITAKDEGKKRIKVELAGQDCPCRPKVDWQSRMIVHNSFRDMERIDKAIIKLDK